jgi:peptidoglycan/xylan/chitin deacetylase (PgdA/CDA1 family)
VRRLVGFALAATALIVAQLAVIGGDQRADGVSSPQAPRTDSFRVALTFDDLPAHGPVPAGLTRLEIARLIVDALRARRAPPVYGFINAKRMDERPEDAQVLQLWRAAGQPLGNHAFSHMDLHANPVEAFEQDVLANEPALRSAMPDGDWHWFRFPYLREGDTAAKHQAILRFLGNHGYKVAEVTLSFDDYAYNEPYARCLAASDASSIEWLKQSYLTRAADSLTRGRDAARALFGRDIAHIMLLHIGAFETVMLPRLLDLLEERGVTLTTLEEAAADPAYAVAPTRESNWAGTFLEQQVTVRLAAPPPGGENVFQRLAATCR